MIKKFDEFINENVFDDMIKRSKGDGERKEDDVARMDYNEFFEYLKNHYTCRPGRDLDFVSWPGRTNITIPMIKIKNYYCIINVDYYTNEPDIEYINVSSGMEIYTDVKREIKNLFNIDQEWNSGSSLSIKKQDVGRSIPFNNKSVIDMIDIFLKLVPEDELWIKKK